MGGPYSINPQILPSRRMHPFKSGGPLPRHFDWGTMVQARKHIPHKLPGTFGRISSCQVFHKGLGKCSAHEPFPPLTAASWLATINSSYQMEGLFGQTRDILLAAWRKNTTSSYFSAWTKWGCWCSQRGSIDPFSPSLPDVLDFFTIQFDEGEEYRTININRSVLSAVLPFIDGHKAGSHPLGLSAFKRGI